MPDLSVLVRSACSNMFSFSLKCIQIKFYKAIKAYIISIQLYKKNFAITFRIEKLFFKTLKIYLIILQRLECCKLKSFLAFLKQ